MEADDTLDHNLLHLHTVYCIFLPLFLLIWLSLVGEDLIIHTSLLNSHIVAHLLWTKQHSKLHGKVNLVFHKLPVFKIKKFNEKCILILLKSILIFVMCKCHIE